MCIPQQGEFALRLPVQAADRGPRRAFAARWRPQPQAAGRRAGSAELVDGAKALAHRRSAACRPRWQGKTLDFFAETAGVIDHAAPRRRSAGTAHAGGAACRCRRSAARARRRCTPCSPRPAQAAGVAGRLRDRRRRGRHAAPPAPAAARPRRQRPACRPPPTLGLLALALAFALLGGAAAEPDALRVPGAVAQGAGLCRPRRTSRPRAARRRPGLHARAWCCRSSRWPALLLALRAGGEQLGWGFQLQSPVFVAALAVLFTLIGAEPGRRCSSSAPCCPAGWPRCALRHPLADAALTGVLAVAVASPCTAPFMGAALGLAFTLPARAGAGAVRRARPRHGAALPGRERCGRRLARALPRPGAWMAHLQDRDGLPDVRHRGLAGLGAGPADRHRRRRRAAGRAGGAGLCAVGLGPLDSGRVARAAWSACRRACCSAPSLAWALPSWREAKAAAAAAAASRRALAAWSARARRSAQRRRPHRCSSTSPPPGA